MGSELGVFRSDNGGVSWAPFNTGLAHTIVESLDWQTDNTLVAFTHGRGAFRIQMLPCGGCLGDIDESGSVTSTDLLLLLANWGPVQPGHPADLDDDNEVGTTDLLLLLAI